MYAISTKRSRFHIFCMFTFVASNFFVCGCTLLNTKCEWLTRVEWQLLYLKCIFGQMFYGSFSFHRFHTFFLLNHSREQLLREFRFSLLLMCDRCHHFPIFFCFSFWYCSPKCNSILFLGVCACVCILVNTQLSFQHNFYRFVFSKCILLILIHKVVWIDFRSYQ